LRVSGSQARTVASMARHLDLCGHWGYNVVTGKEVVGVGEMSVGIRELKAQLSAYLRRVKRGATLVITDRGRPIGRIVPLRPSLEGRMEELSASGLVSWSGGKLGPREPVAATRGGKMVSDLLLEDRE
jgi:prevent-host-death family protein